MKTNIIYNSDCFEINKDYYDIIIDRINEETKQERLF